MIKEALEFLAGIQTPQRPTNVKVGGQEYAVEKDGTIGAPIRDLAPQWTKPTFKVSTLSGLTELVRTKVDDFPETVALHVVDHLNVKLVSTKADDFGRRHVYAHAEHVEGANFKFNTYLPAEDFVIALRRCFLYNDDTVKIQKLCSSLESGMTIKVADDGLSQAIEAKAGTVTRSDVRLPAEGVDLIPWRTFRDANPVSQKFLLRLQHVKDELPRVALFEIDQVWMLQTMGSIATFLESQATGLTIVC